jgi:gamma-glutamyltranspeptidase/glutathione hydrolase
VTLSPTLVTAPDKTVIALSTPGGDNQDQSLLRVLFHSIFFGMNAEFAVESPRFQTEHLVSSFDNHAMSPGTRVLVGRARENKQFLFLFVNNRLEGNAPSTSLSLVEP